MREIISITHLTLDGVMQAPGGPDEDPTGGFAHGGWSWAHGDEASGEAIGRIMAGEFDLLLGRRTYEIFAAYWPYQDDFIAKAFNRATKFVTTNSLDRFDWANTQPVTGDTLEGVRRLKASEGPELHVWGSGELLQSLIGADLVDEFRVWLYPVILGKGKRLFEAGVPPRALELVGSERTSAGVLLNTYRPAGAVKPGSFETGPPSDAELARRRKLAAEDTDQNFSTRRRTMATPAKNTICLWYDGDAEEAANFYAETFPDSFVTAVHRAPGDNPSGKEGDILTVEFTLMGIPCLGLNGGPMFKHSEAFSFQVATVDQEETDRYWNAIIDNGGEASACGWCKDKWGLSWQITPIVMTQAYTSGDRAAAKRAFDAMMQMSKIDIATIEKALRG